MVGVVKIKEILCAKMDAVRSSVGVEVVRIGVHVRIATNDLVGAGSSSKTTHWVNTFAH